MQSTLHCKRKPACCLSDRPATHPKERVLLHGLRDTLVGQCIGALVADVARMALHPAPFDMVQRGERLQALPEVHVLHRLLVGRFPAALLPAVDPGRDAVLHVLAVGVEHDVAGALEARQRFDDGRQFHAVVGGRGLAAEQLFLVLAAAEPRAPAAGAWVALAGAIRIDHHLGPCNERRHHKSFVSIQSMSTRWMWLLVTTEGAAAVAVFFLRASPISRMPRTRFTATSM